MNDNTRSVRADGASDESLREFLDRGGRVPDRGGVFLLEMAAWVRFVPAYAADWRRTGLDLLVGDETPEVCQRGAWIIALLDDAAIAEEVADQFPEAERQACYRCAFADLDPDDPTED